MSKVLHQRRAELDALVKSGVDPVEACRRLGYTRPVQAARQAGYAAVRRTGTASVDVGEPESTHALAHRRLRSIISAGADTQAVSAARAALEHKLASDAAGISTDDATGARVVLIVPDNGRGPAPTQRAIEVDSPESADDLLAYLAGRREHVRVVVKPLPTREVASDVAEPTPVTKKHSGRKAPRVIFGTGATT